MKRVYAILFILAVIVALAGCGRPSVKVPAMDEVNNEGYYHYTADDLGFGIYLPSDFIYYQTQRKANDIFTDLEIHVPTADPSAASNEVPNYSLPITVRVFDGKYWNDKMSDEERGEYAKAGEGNGKVYAILFWTKTPSDWKTKWTDEMKNDILKRFEVK